MPLVPRLYQVQLGMGYLELPQIEVPHGKLTNTLLSNRNVYILDCYMDVYVWYVRLQSNYQLFYQLLQNLFITMNRYCLLQYDNSKLLVFLILLIVIIIRIISVV